MAFLFFFFLNDPAPTEIYTLPLHAALPIPQGWRPSRSATVATSGESPRVIASPPLRRSEEHTSELQSRLHLVCRLLLEKKKNMRTLNPDLVLPSELGA